MKIILISTLSSHYTSSLGAVSLERFHTCCEHTVLFNGLIELLCIVNKHAVNQGDVGLQRVDITEWHQHTRPLVKLLHELVM